MFRLRPALASVAVTALAAAVVITVSVAPLAAAAAPLFTGDYATGNFSQWPTVQTKTYNSSGKGYVPTYSATIVQDASERQRARFEVRAAMCPHSGAVNAPRCRPTKLQPAAPKGQIRWYRFSTKFDSTFPQNHANLGWG